MKNLIKKGIILITLIVFFSVVNFVYAGDTQVINFNGDNTSSQYFGKPFVDILARKIVPNADYDNINVSVGLKKVGSPTDDVIVSIQSDSSGFPNGTPIETLNIDGAELSTTQTTAFALGDITVSLLDGVIYWIVFDRSGSQDSSNYYEINKGAKDGSGHLLAAYHYDGTWYSDTNNWDFQGSATLSTSAVSSRRIIMIE